MFRRLFNIKTSVTIELSITTLKLHTCISTVPVEYRANNITYYEESTHMQRDYGVCIDIEQVH